MSGHVDIRVTVAAPLAAVWADANDPARWAAAGHPVTDVSDIAGRTRFRVTTPPDREGRTFAYTVERTADEAAKTVYSRRFDSSDFRYGHVWFAYTATEAGTEMRCVVDFEMTAAAQVTDADMAALMENGMRRNMIETARQIELRGRGHHDG